MAALKFKGIEIELADGVVRVAPPLNMRALMLYGDAIGKFDGSMNSECMETAVSVIHSSLVRNYPELTRDDVLDLVDVVNVGSAMQAVMGVSKLKERVESGEALRASTGPS